ncbi:MAG TPA: diadenylate cyclase CdaA [Candidatus Dormibacteraeota bacterium]|nr:diadenylate cyclase CdaA [Candidatus Dormibacteraeota bacterium]
MEFIDTAFNQLTAIVGRVGPIEVIDVLAVAFILYQLLRLVKGTQATQLIVGLVMLGIIGLAATQLHLILLGWLFQNAAPIAVLAIVVLFQPELRRILDQVGRLGHLPGRPLSAFNAQLFNRSVTEAIRAAEKLAQRRVGALIAFEREVGLEDYAATGVRINGEVSAEFLQSIFFPNSPLHDGAVIVRNNTILAAGCLLPLADEAQVRERLGTRHRAAIGLSLASDALILVVSEETGGISVVENGRIDRSLDGDRLRQRLTGGLETTSPNGGGRQVLGIGWRLSGPKP